MKLIIIVLLITSVFANDVCQCPETCLGKEELGRGTWLLLHSIVRNIDKTDENELLFYDFMEILSQLYPCSECRDHFIRNLNEIDQMQMSEEWMCAFHNRINEQLDKPLYPCDATS